MSEKTFTKIIWIIAILGIISIAALGIWSYLLYKDCSIISYIANRG
ncbi:hypothetical protein WAA20_08830 [Butyrivibrio fibrisolvens]|nr:hypothetical protein [Butyrivibrio fibrisolvens]